MTNENEKPRKQTRAEQLNQFLTENAKLFTLDSWAALTKEVSLPQAFHAALITGRPELLRLVPPSDLSKQETAAMYDLVATLIETNMQLQQHAQLVSQSVHIWSDAFKQLESVGRQVVNFADFKHTLREDEG